MPANNLCVGKAIMILTNFIFLLAGLALVGAGIALLMDSPRILLSRLILPASSGVYVVGLNPNPTSPSAPPPIPPTVMSLPQQPIFYYAALIAMAVGTVVCAVAVLGCWAARLRKCGILTAYLFVLSLMLLGELSVIILSALAPQLLGLVFDSGRLLAVLQRGYGAPGSEQLTAAVDLAQATMECCGVRGPSDYNASGWRLRELGRRELRVPLSCCQLANADQPLAFLDPRPTNQTVCQSPEESPERHQDGCGSRIAEWLSQQVAIAGAAGGGLLVLQLIALFVAIFVCVQLAAYRSKPFQDGSSSGHINAGMAETSGAETTTEDDGEGADERHLPLHETQLGIDPPIYGTSATKELPLSPSALIAQQEGPPVPAAPVGYGVCRTTPMPASPRRSQPPRPPPKPTIVPASCGCDMLYYQQTNQMIDPGLYQYVEELRAAEELRSSPYQQALVAAASRRSTHGRSRRQNRTDQQQIYQQTMQQQQPVYQQQPSCYAHAPHHTLQPTWQQTSLYETRPTRSYPDNQAVPQQPRQHESLQQSQKYVQQQTWQRRQQQLHEQQLQQQKLQQQQIEQQQIHQQQQQLQQQQLQQQQLNQQQLQEQQIQLQQQQQQLQYQKQLQQEQQQVKQNSYLHKNEDDLTEKYQAEQPSQELIQQEYSSKGTLVGNGKISRHEAVRVSNPLRPA